MKSGSKLILLFLFSLSHHLSAASVETIKIPSTKMKRDLPAVLILPDAYKKTEKKQHFPVIYLLHGAGGNEKDWTKHTNITRLADQYKVIILCPNGGVTSWYFDSPIDPNYQFESYIARDCVKFMDQHYRTLPNRQSRALCGLSMGGHGALFLAIRHGDLFGTAVALSGGVDIRPFPNNWDIKKRLGDKKSHPSNWEKYTVINLAQTLKNGDLAISLDVGTNDFFLKVNRALHQQFLKAGIDHQYTERPGSHNWGYWKKAIIRQMPFISKHLSFSNSQESKIKNQK